MLVQYLVRKGGIEPPRLLPHRILSPARLPIPPLSRSKNRSPSDFCNLGSVPCQVEPEIYGMSKILLIEPDRMLQQAFIMALFPEHQVKVAHPIPELAPEETELLIVDAVALQRREALSAQQLRLLAAWKLPMIWVGGDQLIPAALRGKVVGIEPPLVKQDLQRALAQCLGKTAIPKRDGGAPAGRSETRAVAKPRALRKTIAAPSDSGQFIELVDVVEELSASENPLAK